jgi:predicted branched-subunit amino acid permease
MTTSDLVTHTRPAPLPPGGDPPGPVSPRAAALRDAVSVLSGIASFGLMLGVTISALGSNPLAGLAGTFLVYGGSAQLTAVALLDRGIALPIAVLTAAVVNLRLLLYSAALGERFRMQPRWFRWLAPHLIIDQTYLVATTRPSFTGADFRRYWIWVGASVLAIWTSSVAAGIALAPLLPDLPHLGLVATALFIGMLIPRLTSRPAVVAAMTGGAVAAAVSVVLPALGIIAGALAGVGAALVVSRND